jgi:hypothetical protein
MSNQLPLLINSGTGPPPPVATLSLAEEDPRILKRFGPSNLIVDQVADFVNRDHSTFRSFVETYYEWMEQNQNAFGMVDGFLDYSDLDISIGEFIADFRAMYLLNFPVTLGVDENGNRVDEKTFIKNARKFYGAKGTEKAFRFLFRLIYNVDSSVYYPGKDILRASDGNWVELVSLKTSSNGGTANFEFAGNRVYQADPISGEVTGSATVTDVVQYKKDYYDVTELFITNKFGTFSPGSDVIVDTSSGQSRELLYSVITSCEILSGGTGYSLTDVVGISSDSNNGVGLYISIDSINELGSINGVNIVDSGVGYDTAPTLTVTSNTGDGRARLRAVVGGVTNYSGFYRNNNGKLSSNKRLYDSNYYQDYSYSLQSEISLIEYKELYKKLVHPAGFKMFGDILISRDIVDSLPFHSEMQRYELPFIGHYTPYRIGTTADLYNKYLNGFNPRGDTFSSVQNYGQTSGKVFVTPVGFTFVDGVTWTSILGTGIGGNIIGADVFEFHKINDGGTRGVLLLKSIDFDLLDLGGIIGPPLTEGSTFNMLDSLGNTYVVTAQIVRQGTGIVYENTGATHDTQGAPLGSSLGYEGYIQARGLSYSYWRIYHHPNTRSIYGLTGVWNGSTGQGVSFASVVLNPFFRMPIGYHFHSDPNGGPYEGTTGDDNQYGLIESLDLVSPNF